MLQHVFHAFAVVLDVIARHLGRGVPVGFECSLEIGRSLVHLRQLLGAGRAAHGVAAERVGLDGRGLALLEQQRTDTRVAVEEVDEFRVAGLDGDVVAEGAVGTGLEGVKVLVHVDVQQFDDDLFVGSIGERAADVGLVGAGGEGKRRERERQEFIAIFHTRRESLRRSAPFVPG